MNSLIPQPKNAIARLAIAGQEETWPFGGVILFLTDSIKILGRAVEPREDWTWSVLE